MQNLLKRRRKNYLNKVWHGKGQFFCVRVSGLPRDKIVSYYNLCQTGADIDGLATSLQGELPSRLVSQRWWQIRTPAQHVGDKRMHCLVQGFPFLKDFDAPVFGLFSVPACTAKYSHNTQSCKNIMANFY